MFTINFQLILYKLINILIYRIIINQLQKNKYFDSFQILTKMATSANTSHFLIDQQYEVSQNFLINQKLNISQPNIQDFNQLLDQKKTSINNAKNNGSYQIMLQQSLTTQDKPFLYQILIQNDPSIIRSSLQNLSPKKVIQLLKMIRSLLEQHIKLGKGQDNCFTIALWLQELVKIHLTTIVSNIQNKQTIAAIRKFIVKKQQQKNNLQNIKKHLLSEQNAKQVQQYYQQQINIKKIPKFQYIEQQKQHFETQNQANQYESQIKDQDIEGLQMDDLLDDDLLADDF